MLVNLLDVDCSKSDCGKPGSVADKGKQCVSRMPGVRVPKWGRAEPQQLSRQRLPEIGHTS